MKPISLYNLDICKLLFGGFIGDFNYNNGANFTRTYL